jgi:OmpA-OmpF porin, OOP family
MEPIPTSMRREIYVCLVLLAEIVNTYGQNLVPNPSFEDMKRCPNALNFGNAKHIFYSWKVPNQSTPDYYTSTCNKIQMFGVPNNLNGKALPHDGNSYIGIIAGSHDRSKHIKQGDSKEYVQVKLLQPLVIGQTYCVKFYVYHASKNIFTVNQIGMYISTDKVKEKGGNRINRTPQVVSNDLLNKAHSDWEQVCGVYLAQGGEQYITIGSFLTAAEENFQVLPKYKGKEMRHSANAQYAYYFIDDVSVVAVSAGESCGCKPAEAPTEKENLPEVEVQTEEDSTFNPGQTITLLTATFGTNKWELPQAAKPLLDSLAAYLKKHPSYKLEVSGFTDNVGQEHANKKLSENRALAVAEYIVSQGISPQRFTYRGYGSDKPLSHNLTEAARAQNRRVEILIKEY